MARNRQRAKQRQEQRRKERLRERQQDGGDGKPDAQRPGKPDAEDSGDIGRMAAETGAPPENLGRPDAEPVNTGEPPRGGPDRREALTPEQEDELFLEAEDYEVDQDELGEAEADQGYAPVGRRGGDAAAATGPRGKRGGDRAAASGEPTQATGLARVIAFLRACWAELQRVQWPDRKQTTQLTAIVLVFIIIMGGYLGLLDAIVSRVVQEII